MIEPAIYFIMSLVMTVFSAYFCYLVWFRYQTFLQKVEIFQNSLQRVGFSIPKHYAQIPDTQMYKWLARAVFFFMFNISFFVLSFTIYGFLIR